MSSTGRSKQGATRRATRANRSGGSDADFCPTPLALAEAMVATLPIQPHHVVIEPSAGAGSFLYALANVHDYRTAIAVERHPERYPELEAAPKGELVASRWEDFRRPGTADWVIGNPPFRDAADHIAYGIMALKPGGHLMFLLRAGFLHTSDRNALMGELLPWREYRIVGRPSFYGGGSDGSEYTAFVYRKGWEGDTVTRSLRWKPDEHARLNAGTVAKIRRLDWGLP